ncbi:MAG: hypothetical protein JRE23_00075 [Deltaproteobacteria bacterium]|nr:hypothetical protein [Deltaproteobacteria bacterium]
MERITSVKLKVAIGLGGGGCLLELMEPADNPEVKTDVDEYGACLDDFFAEGSKVPADAGIYIFDGAAYGFPGSDEFYRYEGEFNRLEI